jgi:hypothetical protein
VGAELAATATDPAVAATVAVLVVEAAAVPAATVGVHQVAAVEVGPVAIAAEAEPAVAAGLIAVVVEHMYHQGYKFPDLEHKFDLHLDHILFPFFLLLDMWCYYCV